MKRILTIAALAFATLTVSAQDDDYKFTVKAGVGLAHVVGADADTRVNIAAKAGISYDLNLYKGLYVIPEIDFALKGYNPSPNNLYYTNAVFMTYLQMPIMFAYKFKVNNGGNIVVKAGPYFACGLFGSKSTVSNWSYSKRVDVFDSDYGYKRFDVGINAGIGFERNHMSVEFEYSRGLNKLYPAFALYNQAFLINLGYRF